MEELLSLKWNNHRSTFLHILGVLRDKQSYTDVTLACDGKFYSVHKLVLSTCSDYFCAMFEKTACKSPVIVLKDIKCEDLEALLDYMYLGEVNVRQSDLASLIKAAENLRIKGLAVPDDEPPKKVSSTPTRTDSNRREGGSGSPPAKRKRRDEGEDGRDDVRPQAGSLHTPPPPPSRPKTPNTQRQSPSSHRTPQEPHTIEDHDSRPLPSPAETAVTHTSGHQPTHQPQQSQQMPHQSSHQVSQQLGDQTSQQPVSNQYRGDESQTFVKVEMEETDDTGDMNQESYNMSGDGYKEENSGGDLGGDLSNDLPEFLQQAASGALAGTSASYPHTFAGPSGFQPEVSGWQGDGQSLPGSFGGLGFQPHSSQDNQPGTHPAQHLALPPQPHQQLRQYQPSPASSTGRLSSVKEEGITASCQFCGKFFHGKYAKYNLKRHLMIHRGEKPFLCPYCPHRANQKGNLKNHILSTHQGQSSNPSAEPENGVEHGTKFTPFASN